MIIVSKKVDLKKRLDAARESNGKIGFVPTMGALHKGHLQLIRTCAGENDICVVSIFVNPIQFGPAEDYKKYPRDLKTDSRLAEMVGADIMFSPGVKDMYPEKYRTFVTVEGLSGKLCGKFRPGHFRGVATVVLKLLNMVQPDRAYFGWKDAQQLIIIKKMVKDLEIPVEIIGLPTVRESDGLAMSSRHRFLSPEERKAAPLLYQSLLRVKSALRDGKNIKEVLKDGRGFLKKNPAIKLQYLKAVDLQTLENVGEGLRSLPKEVLIALAAFIGSTRLIDNIICRVPPL